jgi:excisionase family DNA binding protein
MACTVKAAIQAESAKETKVPVTLPQHGDGPLMTSGQVAELFGVQPRAVRRWADARKLTVTRTLGGHRRYRAAEVRALLAGLQTEAVA